MPGPKSPRKGRPRGYRQPEAEITYIPGEHARVVTIADSRIIPILRLWMLHGQMSFMLLFYSIYFQGLEDGHTAYERGLESEAFNAS